jgi:glycosyltransferase involved in cell wall biosynthesis
VARGGILPQGRVPQAAEDAVIRSAGTKRTGGCRNTGSGGRPLVSVIVPVRGAAGVLADAVCGILRQRLRAKELIVIDGGSGDGTLAVLSALNDRVDYWESAPDRGIYDGMNRGIDAARGQWLYFMGADDAFYDEETLSDLLEKDDVPDQADLIVGQVVTADGRRFSSRFDARLLLKNTVHHQSALYRRGVFDRFRYGIPTAGRRRPLQISGDYQLNLRLFVRGHRAHAVDRVIARCGDGISRQGRWTGYLEEILVRHGEVPFWRAFPFDLQTFLRYMLKRIQLARQTPEGKGGDSACRSMKT